MDFLKFFLNLAQTCVVNLVAVLMIQKIILTYGALGIISLLLPDSWLDQRMQDKNHRYQKESSASLLGGGDSATVGDSSLVNGHAGLEVPEIGSDTKSRCTWCGSSLKVGQGCDCGSVLPLKAGASRQPGVSFATGKGMP